MSTVSPSLTQAQLKNAQIVRLENEEKPTPRDIRLVAALIEQLRDPFVATRLNSFRNLSVIARVIGPVRTREELIPYAHEFVDDDDAVLVVLVEELAKLIDLIGGYEYIGVILAPLETLAGSEDNNTRDKVVEAIRKICSVISTELVVRCILPFFRHLALGDWFTSRQSACAVFHVIYPCIPSPLRSELRTIFTELSTDESPMVRRTACLALINVVPVIEPEHLTPFLNVFHSLSRDDQDSIRLLAVSVCSTVTTATRHLMEVPLIINSIYALCTDRSWRVRYVAASKFAELFNAATECKFKNVEFTNCFTTLMGDAEPEVRSAAASQVAQVAKLIGGEKTIKELLPPLRLLTNDSCEFTRAALARCVMKISDVLKPAETREMLMPIFLQILKDPSPDVRLSLMVDLSSVHDVLGDAAVSAYLLPAVCQLAVEKNWRVRLAIIEQIPNIAEQLGAQFYQDKLADLSMGWMADSVASIREASAANLVRLSSTFGQEWALTHVIPRVRHLSTRRSYQYRQLALRILADLVPVLGEKFTEEHIRPMVDSAFTKETVINVRMNIIRTYHEIGMICTNKDTLSEIINFIDAEVHNSADLEMTILGPTCIAKLQERLQHLINQDMKSMNNMSSTLSK